MKQINFITFGSGEKRYQRAVQRILREATEMDIFSKIIGYSEADLRNDSFFWDKMGTFISSNRRGYGFWSWKPYLIWKQLKEMNIGDILLYADAGCLLNKGGSERLLEWIDDFETVDIQVITASVNNCTERIWTKKAMLNYFQVQDTSKDRPQYGASIVFVRKNIKTLSFFEDLMRIIFDHSYLLTDEVSPEEDPCFKENRHDQSLFSCKLYQNKENLQIKVIFDGSLISKRMDPRAPILIARNR
jgi:hypothetical protein